MDIEATQLQMMSQFENAASEIISKLQMEANFPQDLTTDELKQEPQYKTEPAALLTEVKTKEESEVQPARKKRGRKPATKKEEIMDNCMMPAQENKLQKKMYLA